MRFVWSKTEISVGWGNVLWGWKPLCATQAVQWSLSPVTSVVMTHTLYAHVDKVDCFTLIFYLKLKEIYCSVERLWREVEYVECTLFSFHYGIKNNKIKPPRYPAVKLIFSFPSTPKIYRHSSCINVHLMRRKSWLTGVYQENNFHFIWMLLFMSKLCFN